MAELRAALVGAIVVVATLTVVQTQMGGVAVAQSGNCAVQMSSLTACTGYVVPGSPQPSAECCNAIRSVEQDCVCNALQAATRLPAACQIPPFNCGGN